MQYDKNLNRKVHCSKQCLEFVIEKAESSAMFRTDAVVHKQCLTSKISRERKAKETGYTSTLLNTVLYMTKITQRITTS